MKLVSLIFRDFLWVYSLFFMYYDLLLSVFFVWLRRLKFVVVLSCYWDLFFFMWIVMFYGNFIWVVFGGINVVGFGELGFGVGEEEWGSGEWEVFEGLVGWIEGLVDLVVFKFGEEEIVVGDVDNLLGSC